MAAAFTRLSQVSTTFSSLAPAAVAAPLLLRHLKYYLTSATASSTAAARPRFGYYYDDNECDDPINQAITQLDSDLLVRQRGVRWLFIGFKKKYLYAEKLSRILEVPHISLSGLLRQDLHPSSPLYKQIAMAMNQQTVVPDKIIFGLLRKRLEDGHNHGETGFIIDGVTRTHVQAKMLDELVDIDLVVNFKCLDSSKAENFTDNMSSCSNDGSSLSQSKASSSKGSLEKEKLHLYMKQIKPLEEYYKKQKKLVDVQVACAPGETWQRLLSVLQLKHINAVQSGFP